MRQSPIEFTISQDQISWNSVPPYSVLQDSIHKFITLHKTKPSTTTSSNMTTIEEVPDGGGMDLGKLEGQGATSADDMELVRMGKKPRMKRIYNFWTRKIDCVPRT